MSILTLREFHPFTASDADFLYLVPSAAIFQLDPAATAILARLGQGDMPADDLVRELSARFSVAELQETVEELVRIRAIGVTGVPEEPAVRQMPPPDFPLTTLVLNITNQCNLSCTYCYEYGEDKIVDTANGKAAKFMNEETARDSVDFLLKASKSNRLPHLTFFGGETLLNFPVVQSTIAYGRARAAEMG